MYILYLSLLIVAFLSVNTAHWNRHVQYYKKCTVICVANSLLLLKNTLLFKRFLNSICEVYFLQTEFQMPKTKFGICQTHRNIRSFLTGYISSSLGGTGWARLIGSHLSAHFFFDLTGIWINSTIQTFIQFKHSYNSNIHTIQTFIQFKVII